jgi:predicted metal-dependent hydrolase
MSATSKITSSSVTSELHFAVDGEVRPLAIRRSTQARRMRLSVDPRDGAIRLLVPHRIPLKQALAWAEEHRAWVEQTLQTLPQARPIVPGGTIPFEGSELHIDWNPAHPRQPVRDGETLRVGGAAEALSTRVLRWLRAEALVRLEVQSRSFAARAGVEIGRVAIGDPRGRWGSCSSNGDIRYSWRLIMAPAEVLEATAAHEVAHRLHMDHSPAFHRAAATLLGRDGVAERTWLKRHGAALHWVGRTS